VTRGREGRGETEPETARQINRQTETGWSGGWRWVGAKVAGAFHGVVVYLITGVINSQ